MEILQTKNAQLFQSRCNCNLIQSKYSNNKLTTATNEFEIYREEVSVTNLDKSVLVFSKKHVILVHRNLADFYSIRLRKAFSGDNEKNQMTV